MEVTIVPSPGEAPIRMVASPVDTAVFLANCFGYSLDLDGGTIKAVHYRTNATIVARGTSENDAAKKLIKLLAGEVVR